ncbi:hypothetical protein [Arthrobacter woluwensis]|uniref:hypothetical protein n=1 Tax=Arthrobacter woluwensis TaxID=156980 RepID=UPI000826BF11|nr:hypothetical protein [Arthrobacter woluwensis]
MLLFQNVLDPNNGKPLLLEAEGSDYEEARAKLLRRLEDLARGGGEATSGSPALTRRASLVRHVAETTPGTTGIPPCACCFRTV